MHKQEIVNFLDNVKTYLGDTNCFIFHDELFRTRAFITSLTKVVDFAQWQIGDRCYFESNDILCDIYEGIVTATILSQKGKFAEITYARINNDKMFKRDIIILPLDKIYKDNLILLAEMNHIKINKEHKL